MITVQLTIDDAGLEADIQQALTDSGQQVPVEQFLTDLAMVPINNLRGTIKQDVIDNIIANVPPDDSQTLQQLNASVPQPLPPIKPPIS